MSLRFNARLNTMISDGSPNIVIDSGTVEADVGLTADVGSAQGNGVITSSYNVYSTVGTTGDAATLPAAFAVGTLIYIKNDGANSMDVFPASGDDAGAGANTAVAVANGESKTFIGVAVDATWTELIVGGAGGSGTVTSVSAGNGLDFTTITATGPVTMGTPGSATSSSTNAVTATSHTHAVDSTIAVSVTNFTAGVGLSGGGTLASDRTFTVDLDELALETSMVGADFIAMVDDTDSGSGKISLTNFASSIAGTGVTATTGVLSVVEVDPGTVAGQTLDWNSGSSTWETSSNITIGTNRTNIKGGTNDDPTVPDSTTALLYIQSFDANDYARLGFNGAVDLELLNYAHGGDTRIRGEDSAGSLKTFLDADPDAITVLRGDTDLDLQVSAGTSAITAVGGGRVDLFYNGLKRFAATSSGRVQIFKDGDTDAENCLIYFADQTAETVRAQVGFTGDANFYIQNAVHAGHIIIQAEDTAGFARDFLVGDPDAGTNLHGDTEVSITVIGGAAENAILCAQNAAVTLYYNGLSTLQTRSNTGLTQTQVKHNDGNFYDIGLAKFVISAEDANTDLDSTNQQYLMHKSTNGALTYELQNSSGIQTGTVWTIVNEDTEDLTIDATTNTCVLRFFDGGGVTPPTGDRTIAEAGVATIVKIGVAEYFIWGVGIT